MLISISRSGKCTVYNVHCSISIFIKKVSSSDDDNFKNAYYNCPTMTQLIDLDDILICLDQ